MCVVLVEISERSNELVGENTAVSTLRIGLVLISVMIERLYLVMFIKRDLEMFFFTYKYGKRRKEKFTKCLIRVRTK